jgi:acyl dehydratase
MGAASAANLGSLAASGGAALSAGVGAVASAASSLVPPGDGVRDTGAIPKRKVSGNLCFYGFLSILNVTLH